MTILKRSSLFAVAFATLFIPTAFASAATATIQNLSTANPLAKTNVTFNVSVSGFSTPYYQVSDTFSNTTINSTNINFGGNFQWVPIVSDIGTHTISVKVTDSDGNTATATQTITVLPPPSISIQSISPGATIMPGAAYTFSVSSPGFVNPIFSASDSFSGSSVNNNALSSNGNFSWVPDTTQNGDHAITVYASDSAGHSAQATAVVRVGAGPTLSTPTNVNTTLSPGQSITFTVMPSGYSPTSFLIGDKFSGVSTLSNNNITSTGQFLWNPSASDAGVHTVTFIGQVGVLGQSASTTMTISVLGPNGTLPPGSVTTTTATATTSSSGVSALQAQLAALQAQLTGAGTTNTATAGGYTFTTYLKSGSESDEVLQLQKVLSKLGFLTVAPNGYFGPSTIAAVKKFQAAHGLDQLGAVGPGTRAALNALAGTTTVAPSTSTNGYVFQHFMGVGDDDSDVTELQKRLIALKFMTGEPTGYYGPATETAVKKFQVAHNIPSTGYVATITRLELNK